MAECIFCRIANHEMDSQIVYEDDEIVAFRDLNAQAPVHILVIPKRHLQNLLDLREEDVELVGRLHLVAARLAEQEGVAASGFRVLINSNKDAGQSVPHLHVHLLGGRVMGWPPG